MTSREAMNSPQKTARVAVFVFLVIFGLGMSAELFIRPNIIVPGDAATTVNNITASESLFRLSLVSDLIRQAFMMLLPLVLYKLLKPVDRDIAMLMVIFALVSVPITMLNELTHYAALLLSSGADYLTAFEADQLQAVVMFFLDLRQYGTFIPQVLSLWLFLLGYLVFKLDYSGYIPRILGVLLVVASFGYLIDGFGMLLLPSYDVSIALFTFFGELLLMLWLLWGGARGFGRKLVEQT